jgi:HK97 family phage major capsid protein
MNANDLKEMAAKAIYEARNIVDGAKNENRELTGEERNKVDELFANSDKFGVQASDKERNEKLEQAEAELKHTSGRKAATASFNFKRELDRNQAGEFLRSWALQGTNKYRPNHDAIIRSTEHGFDVGSDTVELRALSKGTTTAGGYTVPQSFSSELEKTLAYYFNVSDAVEVFATDDSRDYPWPIVSDTANSAGIVTEASGIGVATDPAFTQITFKGWDYYSPIVKVSNQLLRDSARDVPSMLAELFAERMGRSYDTAVVSSNAGTSAPEGILHGVSRGAALATGNALTYPKLLELESSVDLAYRNLPGTGFLMHDATWQAMRAMLDGADRPLIGSDIQNGADKRLLGYPVFISNGMTSINSPGDDAPLVLFGCLKKYKFRRIGGSTLTRLSELYAGNGQVGFVLHEAYDGRWINAAAAKTLNSFDAA